MLHRLREMANRAAVAAAGILAIHALTAAAQTQAVRLDLGRVASVITRHVGVLEDDGYGIHYAFIHPHEQEFTFVAAGERAEYLELVAVVVRSDLREVVARKSGDPAALIIRLAGGGRVAFWAISLAGRVLPPPPEEEVSRRVAAASALVTKAREVLGIGEFAGGDAGALTLRVRVGADLTLQSRDHTPDYTYTLLALGRPDLAERLEIHSADATLRVDVEPDRVVVRRQTVGATEDVTADLEVHGDGWWQGTQRTEAFLAGQRTVRTLERAEAETMLQEALQELRRARQFFGLPFGQDLSRFHVP